MRSLAAEALPRVQGRHRNRALAGRRRVRALQLVSEGMTYQQVADEMGYSNKGTVHHIVSKALETTQTKAVVEHRDKAFARLEKLLAGVWEQARSGDVAAVQAAMKIVMAEVRVLGLLGGTSTASHGLTNCGPSTVVISPNDCRHAGCDVHGSFQTAADSDGLL